MKCDNNGKTNRINGARSSKIQQFIKHKVSSLTITKTYLYYAWGVTDKYLSRLKQKKEWKTIKEIAIVPRKSVIDCMETAKRLYTAKYIFIKQYISRKVALDAMHGYDNSTKY